MPRVKNLKKTSTKKTTLELRDMVWSSEISLSALEYWAGPMTPGSVAGFNGFVSVVGKMDEIQKAMIVRYLRTDICYERFLQTRYWHAIRLKVISMRKGVVTCAVNADLI
jgi:hypothetical protein